MCNLREIPGRLLVLRLLLVQISCERDYVEVDLLVSGRAGFAFSAAVHAGWFRFEFDEAPSDVRRESGRGQGV